MTRLYTVIYMTCFESQDMKRANSCQHLHVTEKKVMSVWTRIWTHCSLIKTLQCFCYGSCWKLYVFVWYVLVLLCYKSGRWRQFTFCLSIYPSVCPSVCLFVRLLPNLWTQYFEKKWTDFDANWYKWSPGQGHETFYFEGL